MQISINAKSMFKMWRISKFVFFGFFIVLSDSCETYFDSEAAEVIIQRDFNEDAKVFMAWLNEEGNISNDITPNFLMVDKTGVEKSLLNDDYLIRIIDSANVQFHSLSIFEGEVDYIPSRITSGDYELIISEFDENLFTFTMHIIYPDNNSGFSSNRTQKKYNEEKKLLTLENQKFDSETETSLRELREYVKTVGRGAEVTQHLNTLKIASNEAFMSAKFNAHHKFALQQLELGNGSILQDLNKNKNYKRFLGLKWKSKLGLEITKSILASAVVNGDWDTVWKDEISLGLSGAFAIAGCIGTVGIGCGLGVLALAADAYLYNTTEYETTHIVSISLQDSRNPGNNNCNCEAVKYTVSFGASKSVTVGLNETRVITLKEGVYQVTESSSGFRDDYIKTSDVNINKDNIRFSEGCVCALLSGKASKYANSVYEKDTY